MKKSQPEQDLVHRPISKYLDIMSKQHGFYYTTFPGGGLRSRTEAAIFKGLGVKAGVADILIIHKGLAYWAECKTDKTPYSKKTYQGDEQRAFEEDITCHDCQYIVVRSVSDMQAALKEWNIL